MRRFRQTFLTGFFIVIATFGVTATSIAEQGHSNESVDRQIQQLEDELDIESDSKTTQSEDRQTEDVSSEQQVHRNSETDTFSAWDLYRQPILCGLIAGFVLGLLGVYVVARRIVFVTAALSQVSALGITLGFFATALIGLKSGVIHDALPPFFAVLMALGAVFFLVSFRDRPSLPRDARLGIAFVVPMALVVVLSPLIPQESHEIHAILHGSAVLVSDVNFYAVLIAGVLVVLTQMAGFRGFIFSSLDPTVAKVQNVPVRMLDTILFASIAIMIGIVTRAMGALPAFALTILPAIGAIHLKIGLRNVFILSAILGAAAGGGGYLLAIVLDWSVGASQALSAAVLAFGTRLLATVL
jgi:zinc transport system permease protein